MNVTDTPGARRPLQDVLRWPLVGRFLRWRHSRSTAQGVLLILAALMLVDGFTGPSLAPKNLAAVIGWVHYRGFLVLALLLAGNLFCFACPLMLPRRLGKLLQSRLWDGGRPWPRLLRRKWLALALLAAFFFIYERWDLWASPLLTAWVILVYFVLAFATDAIFQGATFCKYLCPVGQFNFFGALISPSEIKVRAAAVCATCTTKDCIRGRPLRPAVDGQPAMRGAVGGTPIPLFDGVQAGCELNLFQPAKVGNQDCTFCLDCVHACPHHNVGWLLRLPTAELWADGWRSGVGRFSQRFDLAALLVLLTFGGFMNAFGMIQPVYGLLDQMMHLPLLQSPTAALLALFGVGLLALPALLVALTGWASRTWSRDAAPLRTVIAYFTPTLAPTGFAMWLAHYLFHFLTGGLTLIPVAQNLLWRWGWPILGEPLWQLGPLAPLDWLFPLEVVLLYSGLTASLVVGMQRSQARFSDRRRALAAFAPWALLCLLLVAAGVWILAQPMEMRGILGVRNP